ncbi:MAG: NYN domain-containing protein [Phycisphaeraceae bacterium]|nr:NYN domain-containing protein [Phycisphaeraceae bacterium]
MPLLVDAFNVLHVVGILSPEIAGPDLRGLAALIGRSRYRAEAVTLFCDGRPDPGTPKTRAAGAHLLWSGPARSADDLLIARIRSTTIPRKTIVVSTDRAIRREARRRRCPWMTSEAFLSALDTDWRRWRAPSSPGPAPPPESGSRRSTGKVTRDPHERGPASDETAITAGAADRHTVFPAWLLREADVMAKRLGAMSLPSPDVGDPAAGARDRHDGHASHGAAASPVTAPAPPAPRAAAVNPGVLDRTTLDRTALDQADLDHAALARTARDRANPKAPLPDAVIREAEDLLRRPGDAG